MTCRMNVHNKGYELVSTTTQLKLTTETEMNYSNSIIEFV